MDNLFRNASWLVGSGTDGYGTWPVPNPLDDHISRLIHEWRNLSPDERAGESEMITEEQSATLLTYSERMASLAVREKSRELILLGLLALGLDGWRIDWRENILILCLHFDACRKIGVVATDIFGDAAKLLPPNVGNALTAFANREPEDQSLEAMGYKESVDRDGFRYQRTW